MPFTAAARKTNDSLMALRARAVARQLLIADATLYPNGQIAEVDAIVSIRQAALDRIFVREAPRRRLPPWPAD